jgi:CRP/FNR family transcriptional regulator, cyclic AMP receptor protein
VDVLSRMATEDARRLLGECLLFRELGAEERNALVARAQIRAYCAGEMIFSMGSAGDHLMAVLSGSVCISVPSPSGKEMVLAIMQPGELFGETALLDGKERTANARAITACHLAILEQRDVLVLLDRHPEIWPKLVQVLCSRLRNADEHMRSLPCCDCRRGLPRRCYASPAWSGGRPTITGYCKSTCLNASSVTSAGRAARASTNAWAYGSVAASCRSKNASSR